MKSFPKKNGLCAFVFFCFLPAILLCYVCIYAVWCTNAPPSFGDFPPNTEILQQTDTHKGFFRSKGTYVVVAQISPEYIYSFSKQLADHGITSEFYADTARELLAPADNIDVLFDPVKRHGVLWKLEIDGFPAPGEPFDYYAAAFDLDSGLFCAVEVDT